MLGLLVRFLIPEFPSNVKLSSPGTAIILGFQHYLTMVGTAVLIPLTIFTAIGGEAVSSLDRPFFYS